MTKRAIIIAATAVTAGLSVPAQALAPMSMDLDLASSPDSEPAVYATAAPSDFERRPDAEYEPTAYVANPRARSQCVPFARQESGVEIYGDASTWWQQAKNHFVTDNSPHERAVMVLRGYANANRGHVAVIKEIVSERLIIVDHANWLNRGEITRDVPVRDVSPNGDWTQVQVWNVTGQHWGGRVYNVQGFILNAVAEVVKADNADAVPLG